MTCRNFSSIVLYSSQNRDAFGKGKEQKQNIESKYENTYLKKTSQTQY